MQEVKNSKKDLIHEFGTTKGKGQNTSMAKPLIFTIIIVLILGIGTGYIASSVSGGNKGAVSIQGGVESGGAIGKGYVAGVKDTSSFPDTAEGTLKEGGIEGEGEYHLERPGGDSQNVYMTSSAVDLSQFLNRKIKVWGQTQTAQKAGWLMDVGKVEVQ